MMRLRFICSALLICFTLGSGWVRAEDGTDSSAVELLSEAIEKFDAGEYEAAREILLKIEDDDLEDEDSQLQHQKYLAECVNALQAVEDAQQDFAAGEAALGADRLEIAKEFFNRVVANAYASKQLLSKARARISAIGSLSSLEAAAVSPRSGTEVADQSSRSAPAGNEGSSLVGRLAEEHDLLWQQAVATYRDIEAKIRTAVPQFSNASTVVIARFLCRSSGTSISGSVIAWVCVAIR